MLLLGVLAMSAVMFPSGVSGALRPPLIRLVDDLDMAKRVPSPLTPFGDPSWSLCPGSPAGITVNNMTLSLDAQRNLGMALDGTLVSGGSMDEGSFLNIDVYYGGGKIFNEQIDMADTTTLPIQSGSEFVMKYSVGIPSVAPSGAYQVNLTFIDQDGNPLLCVEVNFSI